jgi:hypothetical protein
MHQQPKQKIEENENFQKKKYKNVKKEKRYIIFITSNHSQMKMVRARVIKNERDERIRHFT